VPENVDAVRTLAADVPRAESVALTNETLGVGIDSLLSDSGSGRNAIAADD